jgi:hypothetical protein
MRKFRITRSIRAGKGVAQYGRGRERDGGTEEDSNQAEQLATRRLADRQDQDHEQSANEGEPQHDELVAEAAELCWASRPFQQAMHDEQHDCHGRHCHRRGNYVQNAVRYFTQQIHVVLATSVRLTYSAAKPHLPPYHPTLF